MVVSNKKHEYDESKVKTLSSLEHIRLRPGMYIGRLGDGHHINDGIYILLKEVIDNGIDEFIMGFGKQIDIEIRDGRCLVRDYGRGIPLGKLIDCVSQINTGAKYNDDVFQFSVGLNGVGTKAVNALSEEFIASASRDGKKRTAVFKKGILISDKKENTSDEDGTYIEFVPDLEIFGKYTFNIEYIEQRVLHYTYLNKGLILKFNGDSYTSKNGLKDLLNAELRNDHIYDIIHLKDPYVEVAFSHTNNYGDNYFSFVNGQNTNDGGTHLTGFKEGILKAINEYAGKSFQGAAVRDGLVGAIAVKLKEPVFESQTKNKLGNQEVRSDVSVAVKKLLLDYLYKNKNLATQLVDKVQQNEKLIKELAIVRKEARELSKKSTYKIPNLKDCKFHFGDKHHLGQESMLFITEGQSASGSMVSSRDVLTQAIFSIRGKPLNTYGHKRELIYKNQELFNIMKSVGIEDTLDDLRYNKIIIATDSDVDGLHIRNLLITFFLHYFENLVKAGHLYILETPLFRVRNKQKTIYCYSENEKQNAIQQLKSGYEITRFKGLGEISPKEFEQFIGHDMKIRPVEIGHLKDIPEIMEFFMGKNTEKRRNYIEDNLL